jgi:hypothetical protein
VGSGPTEGLIRVRRLTPLALAAATGLSLALALPSLAAPAAPAAAPAAFAKEPGLLANTSTLGVEFSASVPSDMQRDEGEPEVSIDPAGNIYTCGPSGFSNIADYAQVSRDGGDQFHLIGEPPRGQISTGEGGGDCGLASAPKKNAQGQYQWAYSGLGPLTNFSTGTSPDTGRTLFGGPVSQSVPGVDRQWLVFTDAQTVFLNYNQLAAGFVVQKSTDGGYSYGPQTEVTSRGGRIGPMRAILDPSGDASKAKVYFPYDFGTKVGLAMSQDGGTTWGNCIVGDAEAPPNAGFVVADHDKAGNIYVTYAEKGGGRDTYVMPVPAANVPNCKGDTTVVGNGKKILINRGTTKTTVMPWVVASGEPGRFAVAYYGTTQEGNPDLGTFKAAWYVHVGMSLDAFAPNPQVDQIVASSHPTHFDSICLNGTLCAADMADRTLVDYFAMDMNAADGRLNIVYNNAAKKPGEAAGHVGLPVVMTQMTGPSLLGTTLQAKRPRVRTTSSDPAGDALSPYSRLCPVPPAVPCTAPGTANQPGADFVDKSGKPAVEVTPELDLKSLTPVENGGFTVTLRVANLSDAAKQDAATSGVGTSLLYLFRWNNGYQPHGVTARWSPLTDWTFTYDGYETASTESGQADPTAEKIIVYPGTTPIKGTVEEDRGVIRMSVPRNLLKAFGPVDSANRPTEVAATTGSLMTSAVAYSLVNIPPAAVQSYYYPLDNAPAMDFKLGARAAAAVTPVTPPNTAPGGGSGGGNGPGTIPTTGGLGAPVLALVLLTIGLAVRRRRRA